MKSKLIWLLCFLVGKYRLMLGFCPMCNSDAPELYDCPCCNFHTDPELFPPLPRKKEGWWAIYKEGIDTRLEISRMVSAHKKAGTVRERDINF